MLFEIIESNVDFYFTDAHEIGSSDVSCCVNSIIKEYAPFTEDFASTPTRQIIRRCVLNCLHVLEDLHYIQTQEDKELTACYVMSDTGRHYKET